MRAQTMARRCFGRARNQHRGTQSSAVCPQIPHLPWDVGAHARKISMHFGFFPPRYPISSIVQYTRNMQSIKIPSTRHFENSKETHQSPGSRLLTPPAPSHPLHCCLVVSPQQHTITRLWGEILTQNNTHAEITIPSSSKTLIEISSIVSTARLEPRIALARPP